jgi:uncharacterized transporter YbjL
VAEVEKLFPARVAVYRIRHGETLAEAAPGRVVSPGDILVMAGNSGALVPAPDILGR